MAETFDEFVQSRGPALLRFGYLLTGDRHLAEDLVQDALARVHRRWRRVERLDQPEAYVRKAVLNAYLSWRRRRSSRERPVAEFADTAAGTPDTADRIASRDELWLQLAALPRQQRAVLVLRYYEDLDDTDIAALVGCSATTVRVHASRGLARLRAVRAATTTKAGEAR